MILAVYIDHQVHEKLEQFYEISMRLHITLDEATVICKLQRIYDALEKLGRYACSCPQARLLPEWIAAGYQEYIMEDFHFAFQIYRDENNEMYVFVHDVCHSLLYHE